MTTRANPEKGQGLGSGVWAAGQDQPRAQAEVRACRSGVMDGKERQLSDYGAE